MEHVNLSEEEMKNLREEGKRKGAELAEKYGIDLEAHIRGQKEAEEAYRRALDA